MIGSWQQGVSRIEVLGFWLCLIGLIAGVEIGRRFSWWWGAVGAILGICAGCLVILLLVCIIAAVVWAIEKYAEPRFPKNK